MSNLENEPEDFLANYICEKHVDPFMADRLRTLEPHERMGLCHFLEVLNPSANTLRGYLNILHELPALTATIAEEGAPGADVHLEAYAGASSPNLSSIRVSALPVNATEKCFWDSPAVLEILDQDGWSRKEKQKKIWEFLERLRYPLKNRVLAELESGVRTLIKRYGVGLSLPDELEGDEINFSFSVRSPAELKDISVALEKLAGDRDFAILLGVLKGEDGV